MKCIWDEIKRQTNIEKHGLDFESVNEDHFRKAKFQHAQKKRFKALFYLDFQPVCLIFALLGSEAVSLISMRMASKKERDILK